jgi:hypothetical protein
MVQADNWTRNLGRSVWTLWWVKCPTIYVPLNTLHMLSVVLDIPKFVIKVKLSHCRSGQALTVPGD